jgi:hypothetical protein
MSRLSFYVPIASVANPNTHNIFIVNDAPSTNIVTKTNDGINWGVKEEWHKSEVGKKNLNRSYKGVFDDMEAPVMEAEDKHFDFGFIGFGSFDDAGKIDNIKIWGADFASESDSFL